jgi:dUTP pyrophosphatase
MLINFIGPYTPERATDGSAGYDLRTVKAATIYPGMSHHFDTGLQMAIPKGYVGIIEPRSGLSFKHSIENGAGVIDSDYRGKIRIHLYNHGNGTVFFAEGDRIAQMLIQKHESPLFILVDSLEETERGESGYGHTGVK